MKILSDCLTKENVNALAALLTPFLACIGTYIAWQQYKGNKLKLRHDLYERRFKVYQGLTDLLGFIGREADVHQEQLWAFKKDTADSCFLFGKEVPVYLKVIFDNAVELRKQNILIKGERSQNETERIELIQKNADLLIWFGDQFEVSERKFMPYLSLIPKSKGV